MLLKKQITTTEEISIEVKTPSYYKSDYLYYALCEGGDIIQISLTQITRWRLGSKYHGETLSEITTMALEITRDEFMEQYLDTNKNIDFALFGNNEWDEIETGHE